MSHKVGSIAVSRFVVGQSHATIQAAITAAAVTGGVVQIPSGQYTENLTLASNVSLEGTGNPIDAFSSMGGGVAIIGNHTFAGAIGSIKNILLVNKAGAPTLLATSMTLYTIEDCIFVAAAGSLAADYFLSVTAASGSMFVKKCNMFDMDLTFTPNTTITHLINVVPSAASCDVSFEKCTITRSSSSPPLRALLTNNGGRVAVEDSQITGYVSVMGTGRVTGKRSSFDIGFNGAVTTQFPVFRTSTRNSNVYLTECAVLGYGSTWASGPGAFSMNSPLASLAGGGSNNNTPPYSQILPSGLDIVSVSKANPAVVTTFTNHNLLAGDKVLILGNANPAANHTHKVLTILTPTSFTINLNTRDTGSVAPTAISSSSTTVGGECTILVASSAGLSNLDVVLITNHVIAGLAEVNGLHQIYDVDVGGANRFKVQLTAGVWPAGAATGHVSMPCMGVPTLNGSGTASGVVVVEASGVMRSIKSSALGVYETYAAHGFSVGDRIIIYDHDSIGNETIIETVTDADPLLDLKHFTLTANAYTGPATGVAVRTTSAQSNFGAFHGPIVLARPKDSWGSLDSDQFPSGTLYLDVTEDPTVLADIRGMIAPGVSRSLGNRLNFRGGVTGVDAIRWMDEVVMAYNTGSSATFLLPVTQEEGAYIGRQITIISQFDPVAHPVYIQSAEGTLNYLGGYGSSINSPLAILSTAFHKVVTLLCIDSKRMADQANSATTVGSAWVIISRGA